MKPRFSLDPRSAALALASGTLLVVGCSQADDDAQVRQHAALAATNSAEASVPVPENLAEPTPQDVGREELARQIDEIGEKFDGDVGIAVREVESGWHTGFNAAEMMPQQSVSKLWVSMAALDLADQGRIDLSDPVTIRRQDLTVFHQPLRSEVLQKGAYTADLRDYMTRAITRSDNTANDTILRRIGGPARVEDMIANKRLSGVKFGTDERTKQSRIAGLAWRPEYSIGGAFFDARDLVPEDRRRVAFENYLANPMDGASAEGIVLALARLARGDLLSPASTRLLIDTMTQTHSGPRRLKGAVPEGWTIAHKTGTGQYFDGWQSGYNDIALLYAPDGTAYSMAVMIKRTRNGVPANMEMMQRVTSAVVAYHDVLRAAQADPAA